MHKPIAMAATALLLAGCEKVYYEMTVTTEADGRVVIDRAAPCVPHVYRRPHAPTTDWWACLNGKGDHVKDWVNPTRVVLERMDTTRGVVVEVVADVELAQDAVGEVGPDAVMPEPAAMTPDRPGTEGAE